MTDLKSKKRFQFNAMKLGNFICYSMTAITVILSLLQIWLSILPTGLFIRIVVCIIAVILISIAMISVGRESLEREKEDNEIFLD